MYVLHSCSRRLCLERSRVHPRPKKGVRRALPHTSTSLGLHLCGTYCDLYTLALRTNYCGYQNYNNLVRDQLLNSEPQVGYGRTVVTQILNILSKLFERGVWVEDVSFLTSVVELTAR